MIKSRLNPNGYIHRKSASSSALTSLKGLLLGIKSDGKINELEVAKLKSWIEKYRVLRDTQFFGAILDQLSLFMEDGQVTLGEAHDLIFMIDRNIDSFYNEATEKMQLLQGITSGIVADKQILPSELVYLSKWLNENDFLRGKYPYDEIFQAISEVARSKVISSEQLAYLNDALDWSGEKSISLKNPFLPWTIDPVISFRGKSFCITGKSKKFKRCEIWDKINLLGGIVQDNVTLSLDYLIVCPEPNIAWTHASYGRKVEFARDNRVNLKSNVQICLFSDLNDAFIENGQE